MHPLEEAELIVGGGLAGNVGRSSRRQVTIIEREVWTRVQQELGVDIPPAARRANLLISGIALVETRGQLLRIGETVIKIGGHTTPCERMDEAQRGLQDALRAHWGGGAFAQVIAGGTGRIGDALHWQQTVPDAQ